MDSYLSRLDEDEKVALCLVSSGKDREAHPVVLGSLLSRNLITPGRHLDYGQSYHLTAKGRAVVDAMDRGSK